MILCGLLTWLIHSGMDMARIVQITVCRSKRFSQGDIRRF